MNMDNNRRIERNTNSLSGRRSVSPTVSALSKRMKAIGTLMLLAVPCSIVPLVTVTLLNSCLSSNLDNRLKKKSDDNFTLPLATSSSTTDGNNDYPCHPPRYTIHNSTINQTRAPVTTVYLKTAWFDMHSETFYSYIHHLCSCSQKKNPSWVLRAGSVPHFYVGPDRFISDGFKEILTEFNKTACGPIFIDSPSEPDLTIITTSYKGDFMNGSSSDYLKMVNDTSKIFICHEHAPFLEGDRAMNVFWLTPQHSRYVVPKFFPPAIVERSAKLHQRHPNKVPIFLVLGEFNSKKRNVDSLKAAIKAHSNEQFIVRFMGGKSSRTKSEILDKFLNESFPDDLSKIQLMSNLDTYSFMTQVGEVDAVLPLVDETNFPTKYQGGKKLSSSITWALGFQKPMVIYKPLAEVFGIPEDTAMYWHYNNSASFPDAFGDCLNELETKMGVKNKKERD